MFRLKDPDPALAGPEDVAFILETTNKKQATRNEKSGQG
jgi:hypothetical protein